MRYRVEDTSVARIVGGKLHIAGVGPTRLLFQVQGHSAAIPTIVYAAGFRVLPDAKGSGTVEDPYRISSLDDIFWLSMKPSVWGRSFVQTGDIDASESEDSQGGFSPIGDCATPFVDSYDGQGFAIRSLNIFRPDSFLIGLFGRVGPTGRLSGIRLVGNAIFCGGTCGALIAWNEGAVSTSSADGFVNSLFYQSAVFFPGNDPGASTGPAIVLPSGDRVGGLVGINAGSLDRCRATGSVTGMNDVGGLVGENLSGEIVSSYAMNQVKGTDRIGGLVGRNALGSVSGSYSAS